MAMSVILDMPPSLNNAFVNVPGRGRVRSRRYEAWRNAAHYDVIAQHPGPRLVQPPYKVTLSFPIRARADLDNLIKPVLDALTLAKVIVDDKHVVEIVARKNCATPKRCIAHVEAVT